MCLETITVEVIMEIISIPTLKDLVKSEGKLAIQNITSSDAFKVDIKDVPIETDSIFSNKVKFSLLNGIVCKM